MKTILEDYDELKLYIGSREGKELAKSFRRRLKDLLYKDKKIVDGQTYLEMTMCDIVRKRRELLGFSRKEMAEATGYSVGSVQNSELTECTLPYFNKTTELIERKFNIDSSEKAKM